MINKIISHFPQITAMILFTIGLSTLLFHRNMIKKIIGLNIMDTGLFLFITSVGYISGKIAPIIVNGNTDPSLYVNPVPAGLVLTGIVVSVSVTSITLSLSYRLYKRFHTLNLDEIYRLTMDEEER